MGLFGFATMSFAPYVVFAYVNIVVSIFCAVTGLFIFRALPGKDMGLKERCSQKAGHRVADLIQ